MINSLDKGKRFEREVAKFLYSLDDTDPFWKSIGKHYNRQVCFRNYLLEEVLEDDDKCREWFDEQNNLYWRKRKNKAINYFNKIRSKRRRDKDEIKRSL